MGAMQRRKGHNFEREIANVYRKVWPKATIRRSLQAHQPYEPDVVVENDALGERLWTECQCSNDPTPLTKLDQAERDIAVAYAKQVAANKGSTGIPSLDYRLPIVVWKKSGSRTVNVTTRMWVIRELGCFGAMPAAWHDLQVTMGLTEFLAAVSAA